MTGTKQMPVDNILHTKSCVSAHMAGESALGMFNWARVVAAAVNALVGRVSEHLSGPAGNVRKNAVVVVGKATLLYVLYLAGCGCEAHTPKLGSTY